MTTVRKVLKIRKPPMNSAITPNRFKTIKATSAKARPNSVIVVIEILIAERLFDLGGHFVLIRAIAEDDFQQIDQPGLFQRGLSVSQGDDQARRNRFFLQDANNRIGLQTRPPW